MKVITFSYPEVDAALIQHLEQALVPDLMGMVIEKRLRGEQGLACSWRRDTEVIVACMDRKEATRQNILAELWGGGPCDFVVIIVPDNTDLGRFLLSLILKHLGGS
jgi:hypothetical protein